MKFMSKITVILLSAIIAAGYSFLTPVSNNLTQAEMKASNNTINIKLTHTLIPGVNSKTKNTKGSFDIIIIDEQTHLLYAADRITKGIDVFDVRTQKAKFLKTIDVNDLPNGIAIAKDQNKLYAGLKDSTVAVIDINPLSPKYNTMISKINTNGKERADEMGYDPKDKKLYVANGDDGFISVINVVTDKIIKKISNLGSLEMPAYNPVDGMMYVTNPDDNLIIQINPANDKVVNKYKLGTKLTPTGIAINPKTNQALVGGDEQKTVAWDIKTHKVIKIFNQIGGGDELIFDSAADMFLFGAGSFKAGPAIGIWKATPVAFKFNVSAAKGSHNVAYDELNKMVYACDVTPGEIGLVSFKLPK